MKRGGIFEYDDATSRVINGQDASDVPEGSGWIRVALAALDQAGLTVGQLQRVRDLLESFGHTQ